MSKVFIQIMDTRVILATGWKKGPDEYDISFKKEVDFKFSLDSPENFKEMLQNELAETGLLLKGSKREDIDIIYSKRGILYRIIKLPFMPIDDLEKMMEFEQADYLSVTPEEYEIRYKIIDKYDENGQIFWDIAIAGVEKNNIMNIVDTLDNLGFKINHVDILPASYERLFSKIPEKDVIIFEDDGNISKICILKNEKVFLYADFPIDNKEMFDTEDYSKLLTELRGYLEYYSSRNFGKNVEALILVRNYANESIISQVAESSRIKIYSSSELCNSLVKNNEECVEEKFLERYYAAISSLNL